MANTDTHVHLSKRLDYPKFRLDLHANSSQRGVLLCIGVSEEHVVKCRLRIYHRSINALDLCMVPLHILETASELFENGRKLGVGRIERRGIWGS
jgi:hypothetical protein